MKVTSPDHVTSPTHSVQPSESADATRQQVQEIWLTILGKFSEAMDLGMSDSTVHTVAK